MNGFLYRIQTYRYPIFLFFLVCLVVFFQTKGLLVLHRDGTHFFIKLLEKGSPVSYDRARRFALLITHSPVSLAMLMGVTSLKYLAYLFSFSYAMIPVIPLIYNVLFKSTNKTPQTIAWLFFCYNSLFSAYYLISESITATAVMLIMISYLLKPIDERKKIETVLFIVCCFLSSKLYPSVLFYIPFFIFLLLKEQKTQKTKDYLGVVAISLLSLSFIYTLYWLINYPYQTVESSAILDIYNLFINPNYLINHFVFVLPILTLFFDFKKDEKRNILIFSLMIIIGIIWFMYTQDSKDSPWDHYRFRIINTTLPLLISIILWQKNKTIFSPALVWLLAITVSAQINFSRQHLLFLGYLENICSNEKGLNYVNLSGNIKDFERDAFHLPGLSLLACAINGKTVHALVLSKDKNAYQLFDPLKLDTYPNLERFGAEINVSPFINE